MGSVRTKARQLAREAIDNGRPLAWFEDLYRQAGGDTKAIPWADLAPNPNLLAWLDRGAVAGNGARALKIGCGLGDDAEELARRGFQVTAFDISESAIAWARRRFDASTVEYQVADLLRPPESWQSAFDLVLESYTLQVLPPALRADAIERIASFVARSGRLLVIARARDRSDPEGEMPWPLTREELRGFEREGLTETSFEDYFDAEDVPVRRFRAVYTRNHAGPR